jgi:hypothetical protein
MHALITPMQLYGHGETAPQCRKDRQKWIVGQHLERLEVA